LIAGGTFGGVLAVHVAASPGEYLTLRFLIASGTVFGIANTVLAVVI
jgi:hypothetical protein